MNGAQTYLFAKLQAGGWIGELATCPFPVSGTPKSSVFLLTSPQAKRNLRHPCIRKLAAALL
jgi:hypothetical protein